MKKTNLTRKLMAACSIVALSAVMYGCTHSSGPSQDEFDAAAAAAAAAAAEAKTNADAAAAAAVAAKAEADAAAAEAKTNADAAAAAAVAAKAEADAAAAAAATAAADAKAAADEAAAAAATAAATEAAAAATAAADAAAAAKAAADDAAAAAAQAAAEAKTNADAAAVAAKAAADEAAAAAATAAADAAAVAKAAADDAAAAAATAAADAAAVAKAAADDAAAAAATAAADAAAVAKAAADKAIAAAAADQQAAQDEADSLQDALDDAAAEAASDDAKDLLNVALKPLPEDEQAGDGDPEGIQFGTAPFMTVPEAPTVELSVSGDGMLMAEATDYTMAEADMIEGWRGAVLTNMGGDTAVVYSDIGNDGSESLLDRYVSKLPTATSPRTWTIDDDDADDDEEALTTVNTDNDISWSSVTRPDDETMVSGGTALMPVLTFMGSVHNISGMFSCTGTGCVAPGRFSDDTVQAGTGDAVNAANPRAAGTWTFTPDEGADIYTDDDDYLVFGWWLDKGPDGKPDWVRLITHAEELGVERDNASTSGANLRGAATYKGAAAGKYAMASSTDDTYEGGHFTATATITADFDADTSPLITPDDNDRLGIALSGQIDNFMTGDVARPDWMVMLMSDNNSTTVGMQPLLALVDAPDAVPDLTTMTTKWATGGAQNGEGTWTAVFHGGDNTADDQVDPNHETNTAHPMAVTGTFNAHIGTDDADTGAVGRLQGAFGANKE